MSDNKNVTNILIVEDELLIAYSLKDMLTPEFKVCGIAINYEEAIINLESHNIDIVLLDVGLSGTKSGIDVARYLNVIDVPFIFLTALTHDDGLRELLAHNPAAYLSKPIHKADLYSAIHLALANFSNRADKYLEFYAGKKRYRFALQKVIYVQAEHIYCNIVMVDDKKLLRISLSKIVEQSQNRLRRINRKVAVNPNYIKEEKAKEVVLTNDMSFNLSKMYKA